MNAEEILDLRRKYESEAHERRMKEIGELSRTLLGLQVKAKEAKQLGDIKTVLIDMIQAMLELDKKAERALYYSNMTGGGPW